VEINMSVRDVSAPRADGNRRQRRAQTAQGRSSEPGHPRVYQSGDIDPAIAQAMMEHSAAIDIVSDADREWFAANPGRKFRLRPSATVEIVFHICCGLNEDFGSNAYTLVRQIEPGSRLRLPFRTQAIHRPEHYGENACATLFAELQEQYPTVAETIKSVASIARRGAAT